MEKEVLTLFLLGMLLVSPLVLAQEQTQTYSGFNIFVDNIKLFFSSSESKVNLALEIREKEVNSALEKINNNEEATKNLERARNKLIIIQEKVSSNNAEKVKTNIKELIDKVNEYENLPDDFETYILEEEKTQLTAELVVEVEGKEGQTLTREVVKDGTTGKNIIKIVVGGDDGEQKIIEIEGKIVQIQNEIAEKIVKIDMAEKKEVAQMEKQVEVQVTKDNEDVTSAPNIIDDDVAPGPDGIVGIVDSEPRGNGPPADSVGHPDEGNSGDNGGNKGVTGEVIGSGKKESFLGRLFKKIFGR
jgi:hypothetical protein